MILRAVDRYGAVKRRRGVSVFIRTDSVCPRQKVVDVVIPLVIAHRHRYRSIVLDGKHIYPHAANSARNADISIRAIAEDIAPQEPIPTAIERDQFHIYAGDIGARNDNLRGSIVIDGTAIEGRAIIGVEGEDIIVACRNGKLVIAGTVGQDGILNLVVLARDRDHIGRFDRAVAFLDDRPGDGEEARSERTHMERIQRNRIFIGRNDMDRIGFEEAVSVEVENGPVRKARLECADRIGSGIDLE